MHIFKLNFFCRTSIYIAFLLSTVLFNGCITASEKTVQSDIPPTDDLNKYSKYLASYRCTLGAHRGDSLLYIENTRDAIESAINDPKYAFVEFDVQYSADNQIVVFHDQTLFRLFGRMARVENSTLEKLNELSGGEIATYEEVMTLARTKQVNIEIKSRGDIEEDQRLADFIIKDVKKRGIQHLVLISSVSADVIKYVTSEYPEMATGQIFWLTASTYLPFDFLTEELYGKISESHADYLMLHVANLHNIKDLIRLKPKDKTLVFWDFDNAMYVVHKDLTDRMWGDSGFKNLLDVLRVQLP